MTVTTDSDTTVQNYIESPTPLCMEELPINNGGGQGYGYILYSTTCRIHHQRATLKQCGTVRNRAQVCSECYTLSEGYGYILYITRCRIQHQRGTLKLYGTARKQPEPHTIQSIVEIPKMYLSTIKEMHGVTFI